MAKSVLQANNVTRYQATKFYLDQIRSSGYWEQLKRIVEPSLQEFQAEVRQSDS